MSPNRIGICAKRSKIHRCEQRFCSLKNQPNYRHPLFAALFHLVVSVDVGVCSFVNATPVTYSDMKNLVLTAEKVTSLMEGSALVQNAGTTIAPEEMQAFRTTLTRFRSFLGERDFSNIE